MNLNKKITFGEKKILILIDQDYEKDRRVLFFEKLYSSLGFKVDLLDVREKIKKRYIVDFFRALIILLYFILNLFKIFLVIRKIIKNHKKEFGEKSFQKKFSFLKISIKETLGTYLDGVNAKNKFSYSDYEIVHANDLQCLIFAQGLSLRGKVKLIYDSHELNIFRNRQKKSKLRFFLNASAEYLSTKNVDLVLTVSPPIVDFLRHAYDLNKIEMLENRFYSNEKGVVGNNCKDANDKIAIIYIGVINHGRGLEKLSQIFKKISDEIEVLIFSFGDKEKARNLMDDFFLEKKKNFKIKFPETSDIKSEIDSIKKKYNLIFAWCYIESVCLSYKMALPNKFFQYMDNSFPVIVADNTYLGDLVRREKVGIVFPDTWKEDIEAKELLSLMKKEGSEMRENAFKYSNKMEREPVDKKIKEILKKNKIIE